MPTKISTGRMLISQPQSGMTNTDVMSRIVVQMPLSVSIRLTSAS